MWIWVLIRAHLRNTFHTLLMTLIDSDKQKLPHNFHWYVRCIIFGASYQVHWYVRCFNASMHWRKSDFEGAFRSLPYSDIETEKTWFLWAKKLSRSPYLNWQATYRFAYKRLSEFKVDIFSFDFDILSKCFCQKRTGHFSLVYRKVKYVY